MTENQRKELGKTLNMLSIYYNQPKPIEVLRMMVSDLADLDFNEVMEAIDSYRREPENRTFPLPAKLRIIINPVQSKESLANESASRIRAAISKFGYWQPTEAKNYIGELGWQIVERNGGWQYLCENHGVELDPLIFHAQARDLAKSMLESQAVGNFDKPIGLPEPRRSGGLSKFGEEPKALGMSNDDTNMKKLQLLKDFQKHQEEK